MALLRGGVPTPGGVWADFGSGQGAYTLALAELLGPGSTIYSIDKDASGLATQAKLLADKFPQVTLKQINTDFYYPVTPALPPLDGIVMANALQLIPSHQKGALVKLLKSYLKPGGRMLLVDYNADQGNSWVPYPPSFATWETLAKQAGFESVRQLGTYPSNFLKEVYAAEALVPQPPPPTPPKPKAPAPPAAAAKPAAAPAQAPSAEPTGGAAKKAASKKKAAVTPKKK